MEKQISIIIPTYNMEKYIGKCLDSLLIPELDRVEVLVVNDGSKDRSSEIAHIYADRYPDSIRVIDKANGNYGSCINAALPLCTGRYVKILDADDTFDTEAFSQFVAALEKIDADVVITEFIVHNEKGKIRVHRTYDRNGLKYAENEDIRKAISRFGNSWVQMHQIAYCKDLFSRFRYHQTEGISYTDMEWATKPLYHAKTAAFLDIAPYRYLYGREGQTMSPKRLRNSMSQLVAVMNSLTYFYRDCLKDREMRHLFVKTLSGNYKNICYQLVPSWDASVAGLFRDFDLLVKENIPEIYEEMGELYYKHGVFPFVDSLRRRNYPQKFAISVPDRILIFIKDMYERFIIRNLHRTGKVV